MANPVVSDHVLTVGSPDGIDGSLFLSELYLLYNDYDPDSGALSVVGVSNAVGGQAIYSGGDVEFFFDQGFTGTASFRYEIRDDQNEVSYSSVRMVVDLDQQPGSISYWPFANPDTGTTGEDMSLRVAESALIGNDNDFASESPLFITSVGNAQHGSVSFDATTRNVTFRPAANFNGIAGFDYTVTDFEGNSGAAHVTVIVNAIDDPLLAGDDEVSTNEDEPAVILSATLLANDGDADSATLTITNALNPMNGQVAFSPTNGSVVFRPDPEFSGVAGFDYQLANGQGDTVSAHVTVNVLPVNDAPELLSSGYLVTRVNTPVGSDVVASDPEGDSISFQFDDPSHGTVEIGGDGSFSYSPDSGFTGSDSFSVIVSDSLGAGQTFDFSVLVTPEAPRMLTIGRPISVPGAHSEGTTQTPAGSAPTSSTIGEDASPPVGLRLALAGQAGPAAPLVSAGQQDAAMPAGVEQHTGEAPAAGAAHLIPMLQSLPDPETITTGTHYLTLG